MKKELSNIHKPVLVKEVLDVLHITPEDKLIDATLGVGGHTLEFLKRGAKVLSLEADPVMYQLAKERITKACSALDLKIKSSVTKQANFVDIKQIAQKEGFSPVCGILFDLGISSFHYDQDTRGFSFKDESQTLDMRLNPDLQKVTASDLLNALRVDQLTELFLVSMPWHSATSLAKKVESKRREHKFLEVRDLTQLVKKGKSGKIHPATRAMMALRIAVNSELENLAVALDRAYELLSKNGKLIVISFHSGEDRIVKDKFRTWQKLGWGHGQGPIKPSEDERGKNPRSRSAVMRVFEKDFS